jgi:hypothetical protein
MDNYEMTSLQSMTPSEFNAELTSAIFDYFDGRGSERYHKARRENDRRLYREAYITAWLKSLGDSYMDAWGSIDILRKMDEAEGINE